MKLLTKILYLIGLLFIASCADYQVTRDKNIIDKKFYSSSGFALIYNKEFYDNRVVNKKIDNDSLALMHRFLKKNTLVKVINPENEKFIITKISKTAKFPKIFNVVISNKIAETLELDNQNPYVEILELKKNKTFIAKEGTTYEEERKVAEKAPVDEVVMDDLSENKEDDAIKPKQKNFVLVISDFYYLESAENLKTELIKKTGIHDFAIKKIGENKYRLLLGPFKNFNTLKSSYISLNKIGFDELNIYRE